MKSYKKLFGFVWYCITHRHQRFWQALTNWSDYNFIYGAKTAQSDIKDIYYVE